MSEAQATPPGTRARGDRTRAAIRTAATACFTELGYDAATTAEIGRRAGVSEATVFNHFSSKAGLLTALMEDFYAVLQAESEEAAAAPGPPVERFRGLVDTWATRVEREWELVRVFGQRARYGSDPDLTETFTELNRHLTRLHLELIEQLRADDAVTDDLPATLVRDLLFGGLEHTALGQVAAGREVQLREPARRIVDLLTSGGRAGHGDLDRRLARIEEHLGVG